jgi:hypothetical protein
MLIAPLSESINGQVQCLPAVARISPASCHSQDFHNRQRPLPSSLPGTTTAKFQDGAPCQTSNETTSYLREYAHVLAAWPSGSPDLNPTENLWGIIKRAVEVFRPESIEQLISIVFEIWEVLEQPLIDSLLNSMPSRLQAVVDANGGHIQS